MRLYHLLRVLRAQDVPPEVLRQREVKWLDMLGHWDKWMIKRFNKVSLLKRLKKQLNHVNWVAFFSTFEGKHRGTLGKLLCTHNQTK